MHRKSRTVSEEFFKCNQNEPSTLIQFVYNKFGIQCDSGMVYISYHSFIDLSLPAIYTYLSALSSCKIKN